jgi:hypothetical protein
LIAEEEEELREVSHSKKALIEKRFKEVIFEKKGKTKEKIDVNNLDLLAEEEEEGDLLI